MSLGLGANLGKSGLVSQGIVIDNLVLKHMYPAGEVKLIANGSCFFGGGGTEDRITITETVFNVDGGSYTFAFWAKRNATNASHTVLGHTSEHLYKRIVFTGSGTLVIESDTDSDAATITLNNNDEEWHHYAITVTGSGATIVAYQDGVLCSDSGDVGSNNLTVNMIGAAGSGGAENEFNGYLCNIGIWESVLTQAQVKSIMWKKYSDLTTTESANLIHWWSLDRGVGTSAADSAGGNTGTFES